MIPPFEAVTAHRDDPSPDGRQPMSRNAPRMDNEYKRARQKAVAERLTAALLLRADEQGIDRSLVPQTLPHLTEADWEALVVKARTMHPEWRTSVGYSPSDGTRRLVAAMIRAETAPTPTTDPFAGLLGVDD